MRQQCCICPWLTAFKNNGVTSQLSCCCCCQGWRQARSYNVASCSNDNKIVKIDRYVERCCKVFHGKDNCTRSYLPKQARPWNRMAMRPPSIQFPVLEMFCFKYVPASSGSQYRHRVGAWCNSKHQEQMFVRTCNAISLKTTDRGVVRRFSTGRYATPAFGALETRNTRCGCWCFVG